MNTTTKIKEYIYSTPASYEHKISIRRIEDFISEKAAIIGVPHAIKFFALIIILEGDAAHQMDQHILKLGPKDVTILIPEQIHFFKEYTDVKGYIISFTDTFLYETKNMFNFHQNFEIIFKFKEHEKVTLSDDSFETMKKLCCLLWSEIYQPFHVNTALILENLFTICVHTIDKQLNSVGEVPFMDKHRELCIRFKIMVLRNNNVKNNVQFYANELGVSIKSLQESMRISFGETPKQFIKKALLLRAKQLLQNPAIMVKEVAFQLGYSDPTNFAKFFKKETSIRAEEYRKLDYDHDKFLP
ncbi:MAG: helix-turn-helix domain-containing protein [Sphingobacterium composti]|uniref:AraC family transcriptional regulator n=1 Tax=Sphingobacterium composti TaxID=363260 RepID=UPI001357A9FE|nr:helix-turn-helix domain-containing protein [Sphingobacterium composti Ten et al. 2007 non Yoo et al. 2007]